MAQRQVARSLLCTVVEVEPMLSLTTEVEKGWLIGPCQPSELDAELGC